MLPLQQQVSLLCSSVVFSDTMRHSPSLLTHSGMPPMLSQLCGHHVAQWNGHKTNSLPLVRNLSLFSLHTQFLQDDTELKSPLENKKKIKIKQEDRTNPRTAQEAYRRNPNKWCQRTQVSSSKCWCDGRMERHLHPPAVGQVTLESTTIVLLGSIRLWWDRSP